jgi:hypothetical protein
VEKDELKNHTTVIHGREFNAAVIFSLEEFNGSPCLSNGFSSRTNPAPISIVQAHPNPGIRGIYPLLLRLVSSMQVP